MAPDDELCLCFHVTRRKVENFIRLEKPRLASQLSQCYGAGTGCGWCRPFLEKLLSQSQRRVPPQLPDAREYVQQRGKYIDEGQGTPPADGPHTSP
ncbi:MAG: (2Fe-2S)-binding protein [Planctomycetales bacterium]|nr:(2Fe-2S)-binding protein [Planctomycetales bacterium]